MSSTTIFAARRILTMNRSRPVATHVAVRDGRILGVGTLEELAGWGPHRVDDRFRSKVLMPGMVEGHAHVLEGGFWDFTYVGYHDRRSPDGALQPGLTSIDAVVDRLRAAEAAMTDPDAPLLAWGFDPILFGGQRMTCRDLDRVSTTRPVAVLHASVHLLNVNSALMTRAGITAATPVTGIARFPDGEPNGELQEFAAMYLAFKVAGGEFFTAPGTDRAVWRFGRVAQLAGVTTVADLYNDLSDEMVGNLTAVTADPAFPVRVVSALNGSGHGVDGVEKLRGLVARNTDKLRFGIVKLMTDGSIQGFSARLKWPGYYNGAPNGIWNTGPDDLRRILAAYHEAGFQAHIHVNGDEASEAALDVVRSVLTESPRPDHRHTLQHCQMADEAQFRTMASLGVCVNLFANHIFYWGDAHYALTMGPDRANRMDAVGTAKRLGVPFAVHSDAPITPIGPLFSAWCAVNRRTSGGRVLGGEEERITVEDALRAITLGAAYTLRMDHEIGSIEVGKRADFTVLDEDPTEVAPEALKDVPVWGTVLGGTVFPAPRGEGGNG